MSKTAKFPLIRSLYEPYNPFDFTITCDDPSEVEQSHKHLHCPKRLMLDPHAETFIPPESFRDFSDVGDFRESLEKVRSSQAAFKALPAALRTYFDNEPADYVDFMLNPDNYKEAVRLGLVSAPPVDDTSDPTPSPSDPESPSEKGSSDAV